MKNYLISIILLLIVSTVSSQSTNDSQLDKRIQQYLILTKQMKFKDLMDYIHPSLFKIAPRDAIIKSFEESFNSEDFKISFDTMYLLGTSTDFTFQNSTYKKIDYHMMMTLSFTDTFTTNDKELRTLVLSGFQAAFPGKEVSFNEEKKHFVVSGKDIMVAIKDGTTDWLFLGYQPSQPALVEALFPKEVREHYKL